MDPAVDSDKLVYILNRGMNHSDSIQHSTSQDKTIQSAYVTAFIWWYITVMLATRPSRVVQDYYIWREASLHSIEHITCYIIRYGESIAETGCSRVTRDFRVSQF